GEGAPTRTTSRTPSARPFSSRENDLCQSTATRPSARATPGCEPARNPSAGSGRAWWRRGPSRCCRPQRRPARPRCSAWCSTAARGGAGPLLGRPVRPGRTILCSEEGHNLWALRQPPLDFGPQLEFHQPLEDRPTPARWRRFIDHLLDLDEGYFDLLVLDTVM